MPPQPLRKPVIPNCQPAATSAAASHNNQTPSPSTQQNRAHPGWQKAAQRRKNLTEFDLRHRIAKSANASSSSSSSSSSAANHGASNRVPPMGMTGIGGSGIGGLLLNVTIDRSAQMRNAGGGDGPSIRNPNEVSDAVLRER